MRAAVLHRTNESLSIDELPEPLAPEGGVVVRLRAAALNHRDSWIRRDQYGRLRLPCVLGSDGAGEICAVGAGVDGTWMGRRVIIHPSHTWGSDARAQGKEFLILGMPEQGTLAENIALPLSRVEPLPEHLSFREGAALALAGLTAYRAVVSRGELRAGEHVLISGIGGGVATLALVIARALGAIISVTSSSAEKLAAAKSLGASFGANYTTPNWEKELVAQAGRAPTLIIDGAGGDGLNALISCAAPGGRIVLYGATRGVPRAADLHRLFFKQLDLRGTTMGTGDEFRSLVALFAREQLRPVIDQAFPLERINDAMALMEASTQMGKIVIDL